MTFSSSYLGPLTTTFTPPHSCFESLSVSKSWTYLGNPASSECFPSGFSAGISASGYYAPAVCPSGYFTGCASVNSQQDFEGLCCPSSWTCGATLYGVGFTDLVPQMNSGLCGSITTKEVIGTWSSSRWTTTRWVTMFAWGIRVQSQDPRSPAPVNNSTIAAPGGSVTADLPHETESTNDTAASPASTSTGLTVGAQIAIGVTIPVVFCVLAAIGILLLRSRRRSNIAHETSAIVPAAELHALPLHHELPAVTRKAVGTPPVASSKC